jgi:ribosome-associated protein
MSERDILVSSTFAIPASAWWWRAVRSSGPGGQNVNKVASRVELRVDLGRLVLNPGARVRLEALVRHRRDADGHLYVTSQRTRDQGRNLEDAIEKVRGLVAQALIAPRARRPTRASKASVERRLAQKKEDAARKRTRARVRSDD